MNAPVPCPFSDRIMIERGYRLFARYELMFVVPLNTAVLIGTADSGSTHIAVVEGRLPAEWVREESRHTAIETALLRHFAEEVERFRLKRATSSRSPACSGHGELLRA